MVDQIDDLFRTTHKVKTQQVVRNRGQHSGDIELAGYLVNETGPVPLVLDLRIDRFAVNKIFVLQSIKFSLSCFAVNGIAFHVPVLQ
jgi:hypothetical protein